MILSRCEVRVQTPDGRTRTSYVYGPTAREFLETVVLNAAYAGCTVGARDLGGYEEAEGRRRRAWWEREQAPTKFFFNKYLKREPIHGGAGEDLVGAPDDGRGSRGGEEGEADQGRSGPDDGEG